MIKGPLERIARGALFAGALLTAGYAEAGIVPPIVPKKPAETASEDYASKREETKSDKSIDIAMQTAGKNPLFNFFNNKLDDIDYRHIKHDSVFKEFAYIGKYTNDLTYFEKTCLDREMKKRYVEHHLKKMFLEYGLKRSDLSEESRGLAEARAYFGRLYDFVKGTATILRDTEGIVEIGEKMLKDADESIKRLKVETIKTKLASIQSAKEGLKILQKAKTLLDLLEEIIEENLE